MENDSVLGAEYMIDRCFIMSIKENDNHEKPKIDC